MVLHRMNSYGFARICTVFLTVLCFCACTSKPELPPEEQAAAVAKSSYEALYDGHPELFLDARLDADKIPQDYRNLLLEAYRLHAKQIDEQHKGVSSIDFSRATMDTALNVLQVFLVFNYGDASKEEVVVPMVKHDDKWLMK